MTLKGKEKMDDHPNGDYGSHRGVEQCSLHPNLVKEIGIIKDLEVKLGKKVDRATIAFTVLICVVGIDTLFLLWKLFSKTTQVAF